MTRLATQLADNVTVVGLFVGTRMMQRNLRLVEYDAVAAVTLDESTEIVVVCKATVHVQSGDGRERRLGAHRVFQFLQEEWERH